MPRLNFFQRMVRFPFQAIPKDAILPILSGPVKGGKWVFGASNISYWTGTYERKMANHLSQKLRPGDTFLDLGAHVGYYSLLAARKVGSSGLVIAAEPLERNLHFLARHIELNRLSDQVIILKAAISGFSGRANLREFNAVAARLDSHGEREVEVMALKDVIEAFPTVGRLFIKMDIEGQEYEALSSVRDYLEQNEGGIYLSTHGKEIHLACLNLLSRLAYRITPLDSPELKTAREVFAEKW